MPQGPFADLRRPGGPVSKSRRPTTTRHYSGITTGPMIDLHSHILPGIDDGARDLATSLDMARAFVADGVEVVACTPHILPGIYHNTGPQILAAVSALQRALEENEIPLKVVSGADNHVVASFVADLHSGHLLTLAGTRYVLVEPPHHVMPPRLEALFFDIAMAGFVPILTHPERLTWITQHYAVMERLVRGGTWMQITAGSLAGDFGRSAKYFAERMLDDGLVHILATDAHDTVRRRPMLAKGRELAARRVGEDEARLLVEDRPRKILENALPSSSPEPRAPSAAGDRHAAPHANPARSDRSRRQDDRDDAPRGGIIGRLRRLLD